MGVYAWIITYELSSSSPSMTAEKVLVISYIGMRVPDNSYSRHASCTLTSISDCFITINGAIALLVDYKSPRVPSAKESMLLPLGRYQWVDSSAGGL